MADFSGFELRGINVYELADGLLPEMALATGYDLGAVPTEEALRGLIAHIGPAKTLQDNIAVVQERLGTRDDALTFAANWTERSGVLEPVHRGFVDDTRHVPDSFKTAIFNTAVGRWQERRANRLIQLNEAGKRIGRVIILGGQRVMGEGEHPAVAQLAKKSGSLPTETEFARGYIRALLLSKGISPVHVEAIESTDAEDIFYQGLEVHRNNVMNGRVLAVGNAPSAIQVAAQLRPVAKGIDASFDANGRQLFMTGDSIEVARHGEGPETHQNPFSALGQIARNGLLLHMAAQDA